MPEPTVELTLHLTLPVAQIEPLLRYLRAYPGDPAHVITAWISLDTGWMLDRAEALRLGLPAI